MYYSFKLNETFAPLYGDTIRIPANTLFFRGYNKDFPIISSYPSHFGNYHTAKGYKELHENNELGLFSTTKEIKVIDLRYLKVLLQDLFISRTDNDDEVVNIILTCTIAYGLCSFKKQLELLNIRYKDTEDTERIKSMQDFYEKLDKDFTKQSQMFFVAEAQGVRIAETTNDAIALTFLAKLFENDSIDGFIAPSFFSPYHIEKQNNNTSPELVIFNPIKSGIIHVPNPENLNKIMPLSIIDIINSQFNYKQLTYKSFMKIEMKGGGLRRKNKNTATQNFEDFYNTLDKDNEKKQQIEKAQCAAISLAQYKRNYFGEKPKPSYPVSPWPMSIQG
jgi:hypothetical protein